MVASTRGCGSSSHEGLFSMPSRRSLADRRSDYRQWASDDGRLALRLPERALDDILDACRKSGQAETGGILVGRYSADLAVAAVTHVSPPPPDTTAGPTWLRRGIVGLESWLARLWTRDARHYLGEWHFHPFSSPQPSGRDLAQMRVIGKSTRYQCRTPILLIVGGDPRGEWCIHVEVIDKTGRRYHLEEVHLG